MGMNFPDAPTVGTIYPQPALAGIPVYRWDGAKWITVGATVPKTPVYADGSVPMTAQLTLIAPPVNPTDAAAKSYVDSRDATVTSAFQTADTEKVSKAGDTMTGNLTAPQFFFPANGAVTYAGQFGLIDQTSGGFRYMQFSGSWAWRWYTGTGELVWVRGGPTGMVLQSDGQIIIYANAWKPGGGVWNDINSDIRTKNVSGDYTSGLAEVVALQPKRYFFKGNYTRNDPEQSRADGMSDACPYEDMLDKEFIGLIAQEVEKVMPEMVLTNPGYLDGVKTDDLLALDTTALTYALVNAVKELSARLEALENK